MRRAFGYFRLQLKRFFRLTPAVLVLSVLLLGAVGMAFVGLFSGGSSDEEDSLINIGIVGDADDSYLGMAVTALQEVDSSRFSLAVEAVPDEDTAAEKLRRGELLAYIVLPDDFITEAIRGNVQKVACVTASGATDFGTKITNELMLTVTGIVKNSQKTVYGFQNAAMENGVAAAKAYEMGNEVAFGVIDVLLNRESAYEIRELGTAGVDTVEDPLLCGMLVLLIMLWGITCCTVFAARSGTLHRVLSSKGTGAAAQVLGEYAAYLLFMIAMLGVMALIVFALSPLLPSVVLLEDYDFSRLIPGAVVPVLTISAMQFFLYEAAGGPVSSALLQFFCAMSMGYISGCIYPAYFFPRAVQDTAAVLPAWSCRLWFDELLAGRTSVQTFAVLAAYFAGFVLLAVLLRRARLRRKGGAV